MKIAVEQAYFAILDGPALKRNRNGEGDWPAQVFRDPIGTLNRLSVEREPFWLPAYQPSATASVSRFLRLGGVDLVSDTEPMPLRGDDYDAIGRGAARTD